MEVIKNKEVAENEKEYTEEQKKFRSMKQAFIDEAYPNQVESTKKTYSYYFDEFILNFETVKNADLYTFNKEECLEILNSIASASIALKLAVRSLMTTYHSWAITRGFNISGINPMKSITQNDLMVNKRALEDKYYSLDELWSKISKINLPAQFKICVMLIRYGILGRKMSELKNLKWSDIDYENHIIRVYDEKDVDHIDEPIRIIRMDDKLEWLLKQAYNEEGYDTQIEKKKTSYVRRNNFNKYVETVIRPLSSVEEIKESVINARIVEIGNEFNRRMIPLDLKFSAKFDRLEEIRKENGSLISDDIMEVQEEFGDNGGVYSRFQDDYVEVFKTLNDGKEPVIIVKTRSGTRRRTKKYTSQ